MSCASFRTEYTKSLIWCSSPPDIADRPQAVSHLKILNLFSISKICRFLKINCSRGATWKLAVIYISKVLHWILYSTVHTISQMSIKSTAQHLIDFWWWDPTSDTIYTVAFKLRVKTVMPHISFIKKCYQRDVNQRVNCWLTSKLFYTTKVQKSYQVARYQGQGRILSSEILCF